MPTIAILEPVSSGWKLIQKGKELGHHVVVFTHHHGERKVPDVYLQHADEVIIVDTNDDYEVIREVLAFHENVKLDAVIPGFEYYVPLATILNSRLDLRGLPPEHVYNLRYKDMMRQSLYQAGVRIPRLRVLSKVSEINDAIEHVGFPSVVKPVDCSGSLNVRLVQNREELTEAFARIQQTTLTDLGRPARGDVLVEEYISGAEFSVEGYVEDGQITFLSLTEKMLTPEPYFVEVGHIVTADVDADLQAEIYDYVTDVVHALGVNVGPFHCEVRLNRDDKPVVMEIGARLAGDHICDLIEFATGADLYKIMMNCYLGIPNERNSQSGRKYAGIKYLIRPELETYTQVAGLEQLQGMDGFQEVEITHPEGEAIPDPTSFMCRLGYAIFTGDTYEELKSHLERADRQIVFR